MSEAIYQQVEHAIAAKLHLGCAAKPGTIFGGMHWHYPVGIEHGNVVMRDSDCGTCKPTWEITTDEWAGRVERFGLWKQVGLWSFTRADNPAADCIAMAERSPHSAGQQLYEARQQVAELEAIVERLQCNEQKMPENTRVGNAIEEAAALLPAGWNVIIDVENSAASVEVESSDGDRELAEGEFLSDTIRDAVQSAIEAAKAAGGSTH